MTQGVRVETDGLKISLAQVKKTFTPSEIESFLEELAIFSKTRMLARVAQGLDADEKQFEPYSVKYAEYRQEKGRPTSFVDLNFSGRMLGSMRTRKAARQAGVFFSTHQAEIFFARREEAAKAAGHHLGLNKLPERSFFALSHLDVRALDREVQDWFNEATSG